MLKFLVGLCTGLILAGSLATAKVNDPCRGLLAETKRYNQYETLRFKQRIFIDRYMRAGDRF